MTEVTLREFAFKKTSPYQGKRSVEHHVATLQSKFLFEEEGFTFSSGKPHGVRTLTSSDKLHTKDVLLHDISININLPGTKFDVLGFTLPLSKKACFLTDKEYPEPEKCYFCGNGKETRFFLIALNSGAAWTCGCNLKQAEKQRLCKITEVLDWWENQYWWTTLFDKYIKKQKPSPFCSLHVFISMAYRLISLEGFHRADSGQSTREKLRAFWRAEPIDAVHPDETLFNMSMDALYPERWPDSVMLSEKIIKTGLASRNIAWKEKIQFATSSEYIDVRDPLITGILSALPAYYRSEENKKIKDLPDGEISQAFGKEKQRGVLKLKLINQKTLDMRTYPTKQFTFINEHNQIFRWDASQGSAPMLQNNQWYLLQGTIRRHSLSNNGHITHIYHCKEIRPCETNTQEPLFRPFFMPTKKRDEVTVSYLISDADGRIDGRTHVKIERIWLEDGGQHDLQLITPWPLKNIELELINLIKKKNLRREQLHLDKIKDKALINALKDIPLLPSLSKRIEGYWVDDAYTEPSETHIKETARPGASQTEQTLRKPHWFFEHAAAQQHGRKLTMGRIIHALFKHPEFALCDFSMRGNPNYTEFIKAARARGVNFILNLPENNLIPLSLIGSKVLSESPIHANWPEQAHYELKGKNFLVIPTLSVYQSYMGRSILQPHPAGLSKQRTVLTLRDIMLQSKDQTQLGWLYLNVNETTLYYLRKLGARCILAFEGRIEYSSGREFKSEIPAKDPAFMHKTWDDWLRYTINDIDDHKNLSLGTLNQKNTSLSLA